MHIARCLLRAVPVLLLASCTIGNSPGQVLPTFLPPPDGATATLNEAYPTMGAQEEDSSQSVGGFDVELRRAWREGKQVNAEICFTLPDSSDWTVWEAHYDYPGVTVSEFSSALMGLEAAGSDGEARRCDQLGFYVAPDADLSSSSLTVESVGAYPTTEEYCTVYMPKIQQTLQDRGMDIALDCPTTEGIMAVEIQSIPDGMSLEEAEQLVFSDEFYTVRGPWTFTVTFDQ